MKVSSVNSQNINSYKNQNSSRKQTSFTGISSTLVNFWQMIDNGGRAAQFTVEDMCGTNIPRTYKGAMAGYKYTHKINVPALLQEGFREFLTGPTMTLVPVAIIMFARKALGKTADTKINNIKNLSDLMNMVVDSNNSNVLQSNLENGFFKNVVEDLLTHTSGKDIKDKADSIKDLTRDDVSELTQLFANYSNAIRNATGKKGDEVKKVSEAKRALCNSFETIIKRTKNQYDGDSFLNVTYAFKNGKNGVETQKFATYSDFVVNYANDFIKRFGVSKDNQNIVELTAQNIKRFKDNWTATRSAVVACMIFLTGIAMSIIPKIYTFVSGSVNPNATAIYDEANGKNGSKKEAK